MPRSFNVPLDRVLDKGGLASRERIEAAFKDAGVDLDKPIITTCGSGVTAAILTFALDSIGMHGVRLVGRPSADCLDEIGNRRPRTDIRFYRGK